MSDSYRMAFGRYEGEPVTALPWNYLLWALSCASIRQAHPDFVRSALERLSTAVGDVEAIVQSLRASLPDTMQADDVPPWHGLV